MITRIINHYLNNHGKQKKLHAGKIMFYLHLLKMFFVAVLLHGHNLKGIILQESDRD